MLYIHIRLAGFIFENSTLWFDSTYYLQIHRTVMGTIIARIYAILSTSYHEVYIHTHTHTYIYIYIYIFTKDT